MNAGEYRRVQINDRGESLLRNRVNLEYEVVETKESGIDKAKADEMQRYIVSALQRWVTDNIT